MNSKRTSHSQTDLNSAVIRYLKYRFRSESEIRRYLAKKFPLASEDMIDAVVASLKRADLINDQRFASEWIRSKLNQGKGTFLIKRQLDNLGISPDIIQSALNKYETDTLIDSAKDLIQKKHHLFNKINSDQRRYKIKQYLFKRGYSSQVISAVIDDDLVLGVK